MLNFIVQRVNKGKNYPLPKYTTPSASGLDLYAAIHKPTSIKVGKIKLIYSGIKIKISNGYEAQIRPRSGLALNYGITVFNSPGTIDSDFRGEIGIILINLSKQKFIVEPGMRIAQLVFTSIFRPQLTEGIVTNEDSTRSLKGFGSTGLHDKC